MAKATPSPKGQNRLREALAAFERERSTLSLSQPAASDLKADFDDPAFRTLLAGALILDQTLLKRIADLAPHGDIKPANQLAALTRTPKQAPPSSGSFEEGSVSPVTTVADLGVLVRQARQDMGLSQQAFADLAGLGRRFVSELESGKVTAEFGKVLSACAAAGIDLMARLRARP